MPYADPIKIKEYQDKYRSEHRFKNKEYAKRYYSEHRKEYTDRRTWLTRRYGITFEQYNEIFDKQNGSCAICGVHQSSLKQSLSIDHCHETGKNRELLCQKCNSAIGMLNDNIGLLMKSIEYLKKHKGDDKCL